MPDQEGMVTIHNQEGILLYALDQDGGAHIKSRGMTIKISPEGLHRFLAFLNGRGYNRAVVVSRKKWTALVAAIGNVMMNAYDAGAGEDEDIVELQRVLDALEDGLF